MTRVLIVGAAGGMAQVVAQQLASCEPRVSLTVADIRTDAVEQLAASLGADRARALTLDLFDADALRRAVEDADLVLLAAGPFMRTAVPVLEACIAAKVPYLDFCDDPEGILAALALDERVRAAGIPAYIGCGASPGISNLMAVEVAGQLDEVESIDVVWCAGDEGPSQLGPAVVEHLIHMVSGTADTWIDGRAATVELGHSEVVSMRGEVGDLRVYEVAHPEPVTLPRRFPGVRRVRCLGAMLPLPVTGMTKGLGDAVVAGELPMADAVRFLIDVSAERDATAHGWRYALGGMWEQVRRGESSLNDLLTFLAGAATGQHEPWVGGLLVRASGVKDGVRTTVARRSVSGVEGGWNSMADSTGCCVAAFVSLALDADGSTGVLSPEDWVEPAAFYATLATHGFPPEVVVEPYFEVTVEAGTSRLNGQ